ncbi:AmmeMemoRadiSam system radical SAM enzyme [Dactylosporangium siamense]|uniref:AmmeMemoRadiSam system radical SAM enzyme n=1 Tax=Dactylosporangium siamense TaxID=685454 RepID=A0A919UC63_9ACTN|nr:AmmeMemoRadiSam system radical SAM enzyme [Dactylosporangium siamense]GIG50007.1 AmmeMemoRadiSam system radical SAM enzyme [Dactylosporangium siamense]
MTRQVWTEARLFEPQPDGRLLCTVCPHACRLDDGETGLCRVRMRSGDAMRTATFATSVVHAGPIERKPFYHYRPGAQTLTLAAPGCSFMCSYCINFRISQFGRPSGSAWDAVPVDPQAVVARAADAGAVVALSYTEPSLAVELTLALADAGRHAGVPVVWKSNGFLTDAALDAVVPVLAAVNVDVKAADDTSHRALTGGALQPVLHAIRRLADAGVWVEVSTPLLPGVNDAPDDLRRIAESVAAVGESVPWHLLRFTPTFRMRREVPTAPDRLAEAAAIGRQAGLRHVYVERALGPAGRDTACPGCGDTVVRRELWGPVHSTLIDGSCPDCRTVLPGRW